MTPSQKAKETLLAYKSDLDGSLLSLFVKYNQENKEVSPYSEMALEELKNATLQGGKRIRGSLTHFTYTLLGGKDLENIKQVEMALEINNTYILIADDVMDLSPLRRGSKTIHQNVTEYLQNNYPNNRRDLVHIGHSQAINICLIGAHLSQLVVLNSGLSDQAKVDALKQINEGNITTAQGQILDIFGEVKPHLSEEEILQIMELKTSNYTFVNPILLGAAIAGVSQEQKELLIEFAIKVGIAFQIQDDILGMFGDEKKLGKPCDSDLKEGKHTLLIKNALEKASDEQKEIIMNSLGNPNISEEDHEAVRKIIIETGSLEASKVLAKKMIVEAEQIFTGNFSENTDQESYEYLLGLIHYMIERDL